MAIPFNQETLESTAAFSFLVRTVAFKNINWSDLYRNLRKAQQRLGVVAKVLTKMGATVWAQAMMYKLVVQLVLLYRSKSWVVTEVMFKVM